MAMKLEEKLEQRRELELRDLSIIDEFQECVYGAEVQDLECLMAFQQGCLAFAQRVFAEKVQNCVRAVPITSFAVSPSKIGGKSSSFQLFLTVQPLD